MKSSFHVALGGSYPYLNQHVRGGVEAVLRSLKHGFDLYEPDISVSILTGSNSVKKDWEIHGDIIYIKQPKHKLGTVYLSRYPLRIRKVLREAEFQLLNAHTSDFGWYGLKEKELVYTLHGVCWEEKRYVAPHRRPFWDLLYGKKQKRILKETRYLIAISPYIVDITEGMTSATVFEVPNPVENVYFDLITNEVPGRMFHIGVLSKRKNLLTLVRALRLVRRETNDFKLAVAGKITDNSYFADIKRFVRKNNLRNNIEFLGEVTDAQKYEEFSKMSFLVLPSFQETAPCVLAESFAAGKPVIASNVGGIPYMMDGGKNGLLIDPTDEADLADKIVYFLQNPKEARSMGKCARKYAERIHGLKRVTHQYRRVFETVSDCL